MKALLLLALLPFTAHADDNRPLTVQITTAADGNQHLRWKIPLNLDAALAPTLDVPAGCTSLQAIRSWSDEFGHWREARWQCQGGLAGKVIGIRYPSNAPTLATIARLDAEGGTATTTVLLQPGEGRLEIPAPR